MDPFHLPLQRDFSSSFHGRSFNRESTMAGPQIGPSVPHFPYYWKRPFLSGFPAHPFPDGVPSHGSWKWPQSSPPICLEEGPFFCSSLERRPEIQAGLGRHSSAAFRSPDGVSSPFSQPQTCGAPLSIRRLARNVGGDQLFSRSHYDRLFVLSARAPLSVLIVPHRRHCLSGLIYPPVFLL